MLTSLSITAHSAEHMTSIAQLLPRAVCGLGACSCCHALSASACVDMGPFTCKILSE